MRAEWQLTLTVSGVADEHAAYNARVMFALQRLFQLDAADVTTSVYAERNHDGIERVYELMPEEELPC